MGDLAHDGAAVEARHCSPVYGRSRIMRVLIVSRPAHPAPPEMFMAIMEAFANWRQRYKPIMETFDFFISGGGGCGIVNSPDETTLTQMMLEFPWAPFSHVTVDLLADGDVTMERARETFARMFGGRAA
jgi:hypothetical protein